MAHLFAWRMKEYAWGRLGFLAGLVALLLLPACQGSSGPLPGATGKPPAAITVQKTQDQLRAEREAAWQGFLADPAGSGFDYRSDRITVCYRPGASLPLGFSYVPPSNSLRAAAQPNAMLRQYHGCERITDAIASTYGLVVCNQVYSGQTRMAGFEVPSGVDADAVLRRIRSELGSVVASAAYSTRGHPDYTPDDPDFLASDASGGLQWEMHRMGFPRAWDETKGSSDIGIASLDSGLNLTHEEFQNTVLDPAVSFPAANVDVVNHDNTMEDLHGHGSGVSGLIAAEMDDGITITGGAPGLSIIPIKITNDWFDGTDADLLEGMYLAAQLGAKVITMSFFWPPTPEIENACDDLYSQGVLLVCSAGNDDSDEVNYPAAYPSVMSAGATNVDDARISHPGIWGSNYNSTVEISAPGEDYRSCFNLADTGATAYQDFGGTSGSSPLVGACAALAWSVFPEWSNEQIRQALVETGAPTTGFPHSVPRADIGNFFEQYTQNFSIVEPANLLAHGEVELDLNVHGDFTSIAGSLAGAPFETLTAAPWAFSLDTTSVTAGPALIEFTGYSLEEPLTHSLTLFMDNAPDQYPLLAIAETPDDPLQIIDAKQTNAAIMNGLLFLPNSQWSPSQAMAHGKGGWSIDTVDPFEGAASYYCGQPEQQAYGAYEMDCLVTRRINLEGVTDPTLVFEQHYNIEDGGNGYDRGVLLVSADYGATWEPATTREETQAWYTGNQPDWSQAEVDLAEYAGQRIHIAFCFESDGSVSGEDEEAPSGWWLDNIAVAANYSTSISSIAAMTTDVPVLGSVPGESTLNVSVDSPQDVSRIDYTLDLYPVDEVNSYDQQLSVDAEPFSAQLSLPAHVLRNHLALLTARCYDAQGQLGVTRTLQIPVFNLRGDANLDNIVDQQDVVAIEASLGAQAGQPGYSCFLDSDLDGVVTEADAAAVGYSWGASL